MRKIIVMLCIASLTGCGLFHKTIKENHSSDSKTEQGSKKETNEVDTGSTQTKEIWKFRIPYSFGGTSNNVPTNANIPLPGSDQGATIESLRAALNEMMLKNGNMSGTIGFMEAELTRFINESRGKTTHTKEADSLSKKETTLDTSVKKTPAIPWYIYVIALVIGMVLWDGIKWACTKLFGKK